ncbi:MAG: hypothetical protein ABI277_18375, partial [Burkholderiaceae bacterium]
TRWSCHEFVLLDEPAPDRVSGQRPEHAGERREARARESRLDQTGPVRAEGQTISVGNQIAVAEGRLTDSAGKLLAFATTTCLVFPI